MLFLRRAVLCAAAMALNIAPLSAVAHESHSPGGAPTSAAHAANRAEAISEAYELVAVARNGELSIYLDRFSTNEPVDDAKIQVESPAGTDNAMSKAGEPYRLKAPWSAKPGSYHLIVTVTKDGKEDLLPLTLNVDAIDDATESASSADNQNRKRLNIALIVTAALAGFAAGAGAVTWRDRRRQAAALLAILFIGFQGHAKAHDGDNHAEAGLSSSRDRARRLADGVVLAPKNFQRILAIRTIVTEPGVHLRTIELPGRVIPDPNASGFVQASVGGRLSPPPGGFPRLGTLVKKGDVLAYVEPPLQAIDLSDMRQRQGELDQQISIVERRLERYEMLAPSGAVARSQLEDTRSELQGLKERRSSLDKSRRVPEELVAPVDGAIAEGTPVAGQIAQSNAIIFHIVDPARLWIEARSFDVLPQVQRASAQFGKDVTSELSYRGSGFADRNQSIPVQFAIQNVPAGVRAGQFVTVTASTGEERKGIAVPRSSIIRSVSGQDVVYVHATAEQFEPRPVRAEALDGDRALIASGLSGGERVVVQGAELLDQVR